MNLTGAMATAQEMGTRLLNLMLPQITAMVAGTTHKTPTPEYIGLLKAEMQREFAASIPDLEQSMVEIYARHFTSDDLTALIAFYKTPVGQKYRAQMPVVMREGGAAGQVWGVAIGRRAAATANAKAQLEHIRMFEP